MFYLRLYFSYSSLNVPSFRGATLHYVNPDIKTVGNESGTRLEKNFFHSLINGMASFVWLPFLNLGGEFRLKFVISNLRRRRPIQLSVWLENVWTWRILAIRANSTARLRPRQLRKLDDPVLGNSTTQMRFPLTLFSFLLLVAFNSDLIAVSVQFTI